MSKAHPLAAFPNGLKLGLYRIKWKTGGASLAAIGMQSDGTRWIAATNWISACDDPTNKLWGNIEEAEFLDIPRGDEEDD